MSFKNTSSSYGSVAKGFHWIMFLVFVALFVIGFYMDTLPLGPEKFEQIGLHKSLGILALTLAILRLTWRFFTPGVDMPANMAAHEKLGAHVVHYLLYAVMLVMPLSGWAMSSAANFPVSVFGLFTLPNLIDPSKAMFEFLKEFHGVMAWGILALVGLHVAAALKHHFINKDDVLIRMSLFTKGK